RGDGDARIVSSRLDEERRSDRVDVGHGRRVEQEPAIAGERAVLTLTRGAPVVGGVLEKRDEAGDADALDARGPALRLEGKRGKDHVAAVRAAVDDGARAVDLRARAEPVVQRR